jgi:hypothetical protein
MQLKELLELGLIQPNVSPWGAHVIFIRNMGCADFVLTIVN